jgi:uncharacterized protein (DUF849 family)
MIETLWPVMAPLVKACLNGTRARSEHPAVPITVDELATDARAAGEAGVRAVHIHPRAADGSETLDPPTCGAVVQAIGRARPDLPVSLSTGAWIEPHLERRVAAIGAWEPAPAFASVNLSEDGALEICELLIGRGVGVEAGLQGADDARLLVESGLAGRCVRALVEVEDEDPASAVASAAGVARLLDDGAAGLEQVHHGIGLATWAVIDAALAHGRGVRVGLEDTLVLPNGSRARDNSELVAVAVAQARRS